MEALFLCRSADCLPLFSFPLPLSLSFSFRYSIPETESLGAAKYERLIEEEMEAVRLMRMEEEVALGPHFDYRHPSLSLSTEEAGLLSQARPATVRGGGCGGSATHPSVCGAGVAGCAIAVRGPKHDLAADPVRAPLASAAVDDWRWHWDRQWR